MNPADEARLRRLASARHRGAHGAGRIPIVDATGEKWVSRKRPGRPAPTFERVTDWRRTLEILAYGAIVLGGLMILVML
jgi:hypothetical protein